MPTVSFKWGGRSLTEEEIAAVEQQIGLQLPDQYRAFLKRQNGGRPRPAHFSFRERKDDGSIVNFFYSVGHENPMLELVSRAQKTHGLPRDLLEIGNDPGASPICIGVSGARDGKVYFWAGATPHPAYPDTVGALLVADSFDEFLEQLHERKDDGES